MKVEPKTKHRPDLSYFDGLSDDGRNRTLLDWLSDDEDRKRLFELVNAQRGGVLEFPSRVADPEPCCVDNLTRAAPPPRTGYRTVRMFTKRSLIEQALRDGGPSFSSRAYGALGGGNFVLAMDPMAGGQGGVADLAHKAQLKALGVSFPGPGVLPLVAREACRAASLVSLAGPAFDLASFAEQAALRFCQYLFGYSNADFLLLEKALHIGYEALVYQVMGRHFASEPLLIPTARQASGMLLTRTAELIDAYAERARVGGDGGDALKGCEKARSMDGATPVLEALARHGIELNGEQRAIVAAGAVAGTVGNVQSGVCIVVKALFADAALRRQASALAASEMTDATYAQWVALMAGPLSENPPIAFLPRVQIEGDPGSETFTDVLLALGAATRKPVHGVEDPLIWGLPGEGGHACFGDFVARPLIAEIVRHVMGLPGLAQVLDPLDASVVGLVKRWGFLCESYPLSYRRDRRVAQTSLNVAMRIKAPIAANAAKLREVIRAGAPSIDALLAGSNHVHFAWFEFIEQDTTLVLHTVFDGNFAAYLDYFAEKAGDLFDQLFECIENAPPAPVKDHPAEFIALIQRYNRSPALGYFFSAYPTMETARITRAERAVWP